MSIKATILAQVNAAAKAREAIDGETITWPAPTGAKVGVFAPIEDPFVPEEAGTTHRERLRGVLRIDQFLADPTTFDPATDYRSTLPARRLKVTLRGRQWTVTDPITDKYSWNITLVEDRPR